VGALLLNGKWEAGARLILAGQQNDRPDIAVARAAFLERGALGSKTKCCLLRELVAPAVSLPPESDTRIVHCSAAGAGRMTLA